MPKGGVRLTTEEFISRARKVHGNRYGYKLVDYKDHNSLITITCEIHGVFNQLPTYHLDGGGCGLCAAEKVHKLFSVGTEKFIQRAKEIHGDKYSYKLVNYINMNTKVILSCPIHGEFAVTPSAHLYRIRECPKCGIARRGQFRKLSKEEFIRRAKEVHGEYYNYSMVIYKEYHSSVEIICPKHGKFFQTPASHLNGGGCSICNASKSENRIAKMLKCLGIEYQRQKRFAKCKLKKPLPFDFYFRLGGIHFLIEYDGQFHYPINRRFSGKTSFEQVKHRDAIKTQFAQDNGFILIRIPYTVKNIEAFLRFELEKHLSFPLDQLKNQPPRPQSKIRPINPYQWQQGVLFNG